MRPRVTLQLPAGPLTRTPLGPGDSVLLLGEGYVAKRLRGPLEATGARVMATQREGRHALRGPWARGAFSEASHVVVSVPPGRDGKDPALDALWGASTRARWIGYLSATSVYGDRAGQWAFEGEAPTPGLPRGVRRADSEVRWLERHAPTHIFRLAGIYGPGRNPFGRLRNGSARVVDAPGHVVNRVHVDDIVGALIRSMERPSPGDIYNIADGHPAAPGEVLDFAAELIGAERAPRVPLASEAVSPMARSFYAESKRVDITRAGTRLGWSPRFPDYRAGLRAVLYGEDGSER